jgi:hypothetical protein
VKLPEVQAGSRTAISNYFELRIAECELEGTAGGANELPDRIEDALFETGKPDRALDRPL